MRDVVVTETIEDIDADGDGKISVDEYIGEGVFRVPSMVPTHPAPQYC